MSISGFKCTFPQRLIRVEAVAILAVLTVCIATSAACQPRPLEKGELAWQFDTHRDVSAPIQRAAIDPTVGTVHLATLGDLFEVRGAVPVRVAERPSPEARMALAPGGGVFAWLIPGEGPEPLFVGELFDVNGEALATLRPEDPPHGFGALFLGFRGRSIVTATALDDSRGIRGRFQYIFWDREGQVLNTVIRPTPEIGVVASDGTAFLLLGRDEATAYSSEGELLWQLDGQYRTGAIAGEGRLALLNPANREEIFQVHIVSGAEEPIVVEMPTPVHHVRLSSDASIGLVGGDHGRFFFIDPSSGRFEEGKRPSFETEELFLADLELVNRDTAAIGVLMRAGDPPQHTWPRGGLAVISRQGSVLFQEEFPIREPFASRPAVDVTFEVPTVIGFTLDTVARVELTE